MKILHIISSGGMYGAEAVILNMSRMLRESGHESVLGVFENSSNPNLQLHEAATKEGIASHLIPCAGQIDRTVPAKIRELVRETGADLVHAHGYKADLYVYFSLRQSDVPLVSTCHNWLSDGLAVEVYGALDRLVLRGYSAVVAVSTEVRDRLLRAGVKSSSVSLIRNGIDLRPFNHAVPALSTLRGGSQFLVGIVGRLSREKGVDLFLQVAAKVLTTMPTVKFVIVGDGPERASLEILVDSLQIRDSVFLLGRREDLPSLYASMDVMVSSSRQEGLPMTILEGMASRKPWIATTVGDVATVVRDGDTGMLVAPEDVEALTTALMALLKDEERQLRFGEAGRSLVEREFSAQQMTNSYLAVYERAIKARTAYRKAESQSGPRTA